MYNYLPLLGLHPHEFNQLMYLRILRVEGLMFFSYFNDIINADDDVDVGILVDIEDWAVLISYIKQKKRNSKNSEDVLNMLHLIQ